jgi:hypothetical protein
MTPKVMQGKHKCGGAIAKAKSIFEMVKTTIHLSGPPRKKLEDHHHHHKVHLVGAKVMPVPGPKISVVHIKVISIPWYETAEAYPLRKAFGHGRIHTHHHAHPQMHIDNAPFLVRLEHALRHLGKWEGRALSFVIGCGIGALLRMFIVLAVVTVRSIKARRARHVELAEEYEELPSEVVFVVEEYPNEKCASPIIVERA